MPPAEPALTESISELVQIEDLKRTSLIEKAQREEQAKKEPGKAEEDEQWKKGATIRIEVPKTFQVPRAVKRTIYIKRRK